MLRTTTCYTFAGHKWIYYSKFNKNEKKYCAWRTCDICNLTEILSCPIGCKNRSSCTCDKVDRPYSI